MSVDRSDRCPCGVGASYTTCCEPYVAGWERAPTAEALMRSRYAAYARGEVDYLVETHAPETREPELRKHVAAWAASARFTKLEVVGTEAGGEGDDVGTVTFVAHYVEGGVARVMSERSRFRRDAVTKCWLYESGTAAPVRAAVSSKVGRNDPCPCGSGRKHKVCCGR